MTRRTAPRQTVTEVRYAGGYRTTQWRHHLACGHIEIRKRLSPYGEMGCTACEKIAQSSKTLEALEHRVEPEDPFALIRLGMRLAEVLGLPTDSVVVQVDERGGLAGAIVVLSPAQVRDLGRRS